MVFFPLSSAKFFINEMKWAKWKVIGRKELNIKGFNEYNKEVNKGDLQVPDKQNSK